jgi:hypothetical protein
MVHLNHFKPEAISAGFDYQRVPGSDRVGKRQQNLNDLTIDHV